MSSNLRKIPSIFLRFVIYHEVGFLPNPMTMCLKKKSYYYIYRLLMLLKKLSREAREYPKFFFYFRHKKATFDVSNVAQFLKKRELISS